MPEITTSSPLAGLTEEQRVALQNASPQEKAQAFRDLKRDLRRQQKPEFAGVRIGETLSDALETLRPHGQPRLQMRCGQAVSGNTYIKTCSVVDANTEAYLKRMELSGKFVGAAGLRYLGADAIGLTWKDASGDEYTIALTPSEVGEEPLERAISDATITKIIGNVTLADQAGVEPYRRLALEKYPGLRPSPNHLFYEGDNITVDLTGIGLANELGGKGIMQIKIEDPDYTAEVKKKLYTPLGSERQQQIKSRPGPQF